jgi:upstream activation factor subunit UAF30
MPKVQNAPTATATKTASAESTPAKTPKAPKTEKVAAEKKTKTVVAAAATEAPVENVTVAPTTEGDATSQLETAFTTFHTMLQEHAAASAKLRAEFRALEKAALREVRNAQKAGAKRKRKSGNRSPSGFVKPTLISNELAAFLNKPQGTLMARTEVTREINAYIRQHSLQDKENGRKIVPDVPLSKLLRLKKSDELTYFNLQRYMSPHFKKADAPAQSS